MNKNKEEVIFTRLQDAKHLLKRALIEIRDCEKQLVGKRYSDIESFYSEVAPEIEEVFTGVDLSGEA